MASFPSSVSPYGSCWITNAHEEAQIRLLSADGGVLAMLTRVILGSPVTSGGSVGAAVGAGTGVASETGRTAGARVVGVGWGAAACSVAAGAGASVAAGAGAVVAAGCAAGADVAVGSSPPHATIIATNMPNSHNGLKTIRLILRSDRILCRPHTNKNNSAHDSRQAGF